MTIEQIKMDLLAWAGLRRGTKELSESAMPRFHEIIDQLNEVIEERQSEEAIIAEIRKRLEAVVIGSVNPQGWPQMDNIERRLAKATTDRIMEILAEYSISRRSEEVPPVPKQSLEHMKRIAWLASMDDDELAEMDVDDKTLMEIEQYLNARGVE